MFYVLFDSEAELEKAMEELPLCGEREAELRSEASKALAESAEAQQKAKAEQKRKEELEAKQKKQQSANMNVF